MSEPHPIADDEFSAAAQRSFRVRRRLRREALILGVPLFVGLILVPLAIWFAGNRALGPYAHGDDQHAGPWALLQDFFVGLGHGSSVFWAVALGPLILVLLVRGFLWGFKAMPRGR
jgi:hypothetical protein